MKQPGQWINEKLNGQRWDGSGNNDDAVDAQRAAERRKHLRMVSALVPFVDDELAIESAWDEQRRERGEV